MSFEMENGRQPARRDGLERNSGARCTGFEQLVNPMLARAQARGMADMLEMLEMGAVLISKQGSVLFASERARSLTSGAISFFSDHLAGTNTEIRAALDRLFNMAFAARPAREIISLPGREVELWAICPDGDTGNGQLLHCVLAIRELPAK